MDQRHLAKNSATKEVVREYLERYHLYEKMLSGNQYAAQYMGSSTDRSATDADNTLLKAGMYDVRAFIMRLPNCREKMFLYHRYLCGHSVEKCGEIMGISRRSAFRVAADALNLATEKFSEL